MSIIYVKTGYTQFICFSESLNISQNLSKLIKISKDPTHRDIGAMGIAVSFGFFTNQLLSNGINSRVTPAWGYWCFALAIFILLREYEQEARKKEPQNPRKNQLPDWQKGISHLPLIQIVQKERERNQQREVPSRPF